MEEDEIVRAVDELAAILESNIEVIAVQLGIGGDELASRVAEELKARFEDR